MRSKAYLVWAAAALLGCSAMARAGGLLDESLPQKWIEPYLPEKLPDLKYPAYFTELEKARAQVFAGRYKTALYTLRQAKNADPAAVAALRGEALAAIGRREEAIAALSAPAVKDLPRVEVLRAQVLGEMGRMDQATALLKQHLQKQADSLAGHYHLARLSEETGDLDTARAHYDWIHKKYYDQWQGLGAQNFEDAEQVTLMGRAFDRWAALNSAYANNASLNNLILKVFVQAYDIIDRSYWPAHLAAAEYFLSHGNTKEAVKDLEVVLAANPNETRAHELIGRIALSQFNFDRADTAIAAMRKVDATSTPADLLEIRSLLAQRRPKDALAPVEQVLKRQPKNIEALALLASCHALLMQEPKVAETLARVEAIDPDNAAAYVDLAEQLSAMRQYPRAEAMYEKAIVRAPWMAEARNGLGLLLTQSGDEDKARTVLEAAYALDPFNVRTTNYLILLDQMAKMARKESAHFVVFYDPRTDPLIAEYFSDYLESMYRSVCDVFRHEPAVKTYIEVFPGHDQFSARITGSPWIGTVGASTGRVIALCTPRRGENTLGAYNWAQVLRHEFTHTVTLSATDNRIAHWMTEGLAVVEERTPLRWDWVPLLYNAVKKKQLFSMDELTWAFVRPKRPQDRTLAYAQSYWVCQYIEERWGHDIILKMMAEFAAGRPQEDVFISLLKQDQTQFAQGFFAWAEKQVAGWGYDPESTRKYNELVAKAEALIKEKDYRGAVTAWEEIIRIRPMDALPHQRLAGLYLTREAMNVNKAIEHLVRLHQVSTKDNRYAKRIARVYLQANDLPKAEQYALEAVYVDPYDLPAHELLLSIAEKSNNARVVEREKRIIPVLTKWLEELRKSTLLEGAPDA